MESANKDRLPVSFNDTRRLMESLRSFVALEYQAFEPLAVFREFQNHQKAMAAEEGIPLRSKESGQ
ncbi:MAG: hypothetical protein ACFCD0_15180 [Gemmataceae bacterium]